MKKKYGEFECPHCDEVFFEKKKLDGHIGGAHKRNITKDSKPVCKFCNAKLVEGKNWPQWAVKQRNLICIKCKRKQNRDSYHNRIALKKDQREARLKKLKAAKGRKRNV